MEPHDSLRSYALPSLDLLDDPPKSKETLDLSIAEEYLYKLEFLFEQFMVPAEIVRIIVGPFTICYEIAPSPGTTFETLKLRLSPVFFKMPEANTRFYRTSTRTPGIEIPIICRPPVYFKQVMTSVLKLTLKMELPIIIGKDLCGKPFIYDLIKSPSLLVCGIEGSGKQTFIHSLISAFLMVKPPNALKLLLISSRKIFTLYENLPHLIASPISDLASASKALFHAHAEMDKRYHLLVIAKARDLRDYNKKDPAFVPSDIYNGPMPYMLIFIDEMDDLLRAEENGMINSLLRIIMLGKPVGIHLVLSSRNLPNLEIRTHFTSRIIFRTDSPEDSRLLCGIEDAETLTGNGDLFASLSGLPDMARYRGAYISKKDIMAIVRQVIGQTILQPDGTMKG
jgi:S-DNA-T family DNA segregation ATPase FtsK/SpoIIIE